MNAYLAEKQFSGRRPDRQERGGSDAARTPEEGRRTLQRLARRFKVSTLVILRRLLDAGQLPRNRFDAAWDAELERLQQFTWDGAGGGDFYRTTLARVSRRFARALVESTLERQTLYGDAFSMLGVAKTETFNHIGREVGAML